MKAKLIKKIIILAVTSITAIGMLTVGASAEWRQNGNGWWNSKGGSYSVGWDKIGGSWFYFNQDGYMKTGWLQDGGKWYFLTQNGDMKTGWVQDVGKWYFLNSSGDMAYNISINGYQLGADGSWINGVFGNGGTISTTGAAVTLPFDNVINPSTTGAAVVAIPVGDNANGMLHKYINQNERLEKFEEHYKKKLDEEAQKLEKKADNVLKFFNK